MKSLLKKFLPLLLTVAVIISSALPAYAASTTKGYTISSSNVTVYSDTACTKVLGTIYPTDECTIETVTSSYIKVTYPVSSGTKTGYVKTSVFLTATSGKTVTATGRVTTYRRASTANTYGYIAEGDSVLVLGTSGSFTQVKYPVSGGYKYAFVLTTDANKYLSGSSSGGSTSSESAVRARLDAIANGTLTYDSNTVMKVGSKFTGYRADEQCKGYAKNVFYLCFGITPGSTQSSPNNHLLNTTSGMTLVGSVTNMTTTNIKNLFSSARPGDFVQMRRSHGGPHSAIVYSVSSTGVTFLEANVDNKNTVFKNTYTWAELCSSNEKMSVYTATTYKLK